jgi:urease accessory protein
MLVIEKKKADVNPQDLLHLEKDTLILSREDRRRGRRRVRTQKGIEIALALPTGTILKDGDILHVDDRSYIAVEAVKEEVIVIHPGNVTDCALIAYEIGNRHLPISVREGIILTPRDGLLEEFLKRSGTNYKCAEEIFEPTPKAHAHG